MTVTESKMNGVVSISLEWVYTPDNYFQDEVSLAFEGGTIEIEKGTVKALVDPLLFKTNRSLAEELDDRIENLFHDEQVKTHKQYELGMPFVVLVRNDGSTMISPA